MEEKSKHNLGVSLFPGYRHVSTKGGPGSVKNGDARVHVFGKKNSSSSLKADAFGAQSPTIRLILGDVTDSDIGAMVQESLHGSGGLLNVLEIRRMFGEAFRPDPRRLNNRVLYRMESSGEIARGEPRKSTNKKPTWSLPQ